MAQNGMEYSLFTDSVSVLRRMRRKGDIWTRYLRHGRRARGEYGERYLVRTGGRCLGPVAFVSSVDFLGLLSAGRLRIAPAPYQGICCILEFPRLLSEMLTSLGLLMLTSLGLLSEMLTSLGLLSEILTSLGLLSEILTSYPHRRHLKS
jgi:hypothetical protein